MTTRDFLTRLRALDEKATPTEWSMSYAASSIGAGQNGVRLMLSRPTVDERFAPVFAHATEHTKYATAETRRYLGHAIHFESGEQPDYPADLRLIVLLRNAAPKIAALVDAVAKTVQSVPPSFFDKENAPDGPEQSVAYAVDYSHLTNIRAALSALEST